MIVLVCGGRDYFNQKHVNAVLDDLRATKGISLVIQGGSRGADLCARDWAIARRIPCVQFMADWARYGRSAGPIRNQKMLAEKPDLVVAFPGGDGTLDMINRAMNAGVKVYRPPLSI